MNKFNEELKRIFPPSTTFEENGHKEIYLRINKEEIVKEVTLLSENRFNLINLFATDTFNGSKGITLFYVFEQDKFEELLIIQISVKTNAGSISRIFPTAHLYEREIKDGFGIIFNQAYDTRKLFLHEIYPPNFYPLLKSFQNNLITTKKTILPSEEYSFKEVKGEGVYQIPVGPVHAGIIAPGHFRFSVIGETIFNLEIRHFWKHRGIEKLSEGKDPEEGIVIAETICGDETVANTFAYCQAIEKICSVNVPYRAEHLRVLFAEMERIYSLLGDLAGMIIDVAYSAGASPFFILREEILRWNEKLSGSRFYKNTIKIGGLKEDVTDTTLKELSNYLKLFYSVFVKNTYSILKSPSVTDRFETTGIVNKELILPLNLSGPLARASGSDADVRINHPYGLYTKIIPSNKILEKGDVFSRFRVKTATIKDSIRIIKQIISTIPSGNVNIGYDLKEGYAFSIVESSRGQNIHFVALQNGKMDRYKVRTASFCNWYAIEHAVLGNIVPDFPLINKSMNLSYEGNDL